MTWGIMVYKSGPLHYSIVLSDDRGYDGLKAELSRQDKILAGKKGILTEQIDAVSNYVSTLVKRLNNGEKLNPNKELKRALNQHASLAKEL